MPVNSTIRLISAIDSLMSVSFAFSSLDPATAVALTKKDIDVRALANKIDQLAAERLRAMGYAVSSLVSEGDPKHILIKEAKRWKADSIFVGARGLRGLNRFFLGSVSMAVTARAPCSVEVVRSKQPTEPFPSQEPSSVPHFK